MEQKKELREERVEDKEVILIKPYEVFSLSSLSFIDDEVNNLIKYMKFIQSSTQTRLFQPPSHYQSLKSRGEQDPEFWKEVAIALVKNKYNTKTSQNGYPITMNQEEPPHKPCFITIDNKGQVIISPNKKTVAIYIVGKLKILV